MFSRFLRLATHIPRRRTTKKGDPAAHKHTASTAVAAAAASVYVDLSSRSLENHHRIERRDLPVAVQIRGEIIRVDAYRDPKRNHGIRRRDHTIAV